MRVGFLSSYNKERIEFKKRHGFGSVELLVNPDTDFLPGKDGWKSKAADVKSSYHEAGIRISCIGGFYVNHLDADPAVASKHKQHVRNCIELAREIGVPVVAGFAGRVINEDLDKSLPKFKEVWSEHAKAAESAGVKIAFEHCPMGQFHSPFGGINCIATPAMWEKCFDAVPSDALGIEWDASHLMCQLIDPVLNVRKYGKRIYHVHAKDAKVFRDIMDQYGIYHPNAIEHCFVGVGDANWAEIVRELYRAGYAGDLNLEGWHDTVYCDRENGPKLEDTGLLIGLHTLKPLVDGK